MKQYSLGHTKEERYNNFKEIVNLYSNENLSLADIGKRYGVSKQAISKFLLNRGFVPSRETDIRKKHFKNLSKNTCLEEKLKYLEKREYNSRCLASQYRIKNNKLKEIFEHIRNITDKEAEGDLNVLELCEFVDRYSAIRDFVKEVDDDNL